MRKPLEQRTWGIFSQVANATGTKSKLMPMGSTLTGISIEGYLAAGGGAGNGEVLVHTTSSYTDVTVNLLGADGIIAGAWRNARLDGEGAPVISCHFPLNLKTDGRVLYITWYADANTSLQAYVFFYYTV